MAPVSFNPIIINVGKAENLSNWNYCGVFSPFTRIYCITEGVACIRIGSKEYELTAGHLYMIPPHILHDSISSGSFSHYYLHIYEDINAKNFDGSLFDKYDFPLEIGSSEFVESLFKHLVEMIPNMRLKEYDPLSYDNEKSLTASLFSWEEVSDSDRMEAVAIVLILFSKFLREAVAKVEYHDTRIQTAISYIYKNISKASLKVSDMADVACLSVNQFIRRFRKMTGQTPAQYLIKKRIETAQLLLLERRMPTCDIAAAVGFDDPSYFCKVFRNIVGMSPQKYANSQYSPITFRA